MEAWIYNPTDDDRRLPHKHVPNRPISEAHLLELGVLHWKVDADNWESDAKFQRVKADHGYAYLESITLAPGLIRDFEQMTENFFHEHLHPYDESRVILEGSGYWDIRDYDGNWIRFAVSRGDMIVLPPGMYHRFTLDTNNYIKALLLYKEVPARTELLKGAADEVEARKEYVLRVLNNPESKFRSRQHRACKDTLKC